MAAALTQMTNAAPIMATHTQQSSSYVEEVSDNPSFYVQQNYYDVGAAGGEVLSVADRGRSNYNVNDRRDSSGYKLR